MDGGWYLPDGKIPNQKPISRRGPGPRKLGILGMGKEKKEKRNLKLYHKILYTQNSKKDKLSKSNSSAFIVFSPLLWLRLV